MLCCHCPCCWWSSAAQLIFNKVSAFRKYFVPEKGLCSWHCIISKGLLKFPMCCDDIVTEVSIKNMAYISLCDVPCFHFHDKVHKHLLTCHASTPHWGIATPCHCKCGWRTRVKGYSIASTVRRKTISLLYFRTSYVIPYSEWLNEVSFFDHLTTVHWTAENVLLNIVCICIYIYMCGFKTSGHAFRLPYSIALGCSIRPFLDLFHSWLYIPHLSRFFGDGLVFYFLQVSS